MIELEKEFKSGDGGFSANPLTYTQLKRNEKVAIYMRSRDGKPFDFEVFLIKVKKKGTQIFQKILEDDTECYPSSSQFGRTAWSFSSQGLAMCRFQDLINGDVNDENAPDETPEVINAPINPNPVVKINDDNDDDAKPYKGPDLTIPVGEFSTKQLAEYNKVQYPIAFLFRKEAEKNGKIKFSRKQKAEGRGKPTDIFVAT